jgi:ribonuclease G
MFKKLVINATDYETRVALLEDGTIAELFIERGDDSNIAGNIYKGRVQRVLPGMQAAFVDIGLNQAAFIHVDDIFCQNTNRQISREIGDSSDTENDDGDDSRENRQLPIEALISEGQEVLVQVAKAPIGTKGSRVTMYVSLPGRFLVLMPTSDHVGISRRIEQEEERTRLKEKILSIRDDHIGYIARTAAEGIKEEKLASEMEFLTNLWRTVQRKYENAPVPSLLHRELTISLRAVRDLLIHEAEKLVVDSRESYDSILSFLDTFNPALKDSVELYVEYEPIFDAYNIEGDISRALKRKVWLKSGGYIVIEFTEALVAIDVNTGRYVGTHNLEETILKTNLEAVKEIAYQIRLRDIGGIIIIDFIDMEKKSNQEKVFNALKEALKKDRSKTHVLPMSEMGLIQMTRKRIKKSLTSMLCEGCFYCDGEGYLKSGKSICYSIHREIMREAKYMEGHRIALHVNPNIAEILHGEEDRIINSLEKDTGKQITIYPNNKYHIEQYDILDNS